MANALNTFINSITPKKPFYPTPTGQPISTTGNSTSNLTNNFGKPVVTPISSNPSATGTKSTAITPPSSSNSGTKLPPAGNAFVQNLTQPIPTYGSTVTDPSGRTGVAKFDPNTGQPLTDPNPTPMPTPTPPPSATDTAFSEYIKSLQPSAGVTNAKTAYNDFVANQTQSINGLEGQGRGIPLSIIRGQQEKLKNQTDPEATRLQNAIGIAQDSATNTTNASKALYDYETTKDTANAAANKPIVVDGALYQLQSDGTYKAVAGTPGGTSSSSTGFTLSPGEVRYDANGKQIASGGPKPLTQAQETAQIATTAAEKSAQQSATQSIGLVNNLLSGDAYKSITGVGQNPLNIFGISNGKSINDYNQLQGLLKLGIRGLLKGQGAISDYEGKILGQAASDLGRNLSNEDFGQALKKIRGVLQTNAGGETDVIIKDKNGKVLGQASLDGQDIYDAVNDGNTVEYL